MKIKISLLVLITIGVIIPLMMSAQVYPVLPGGGVEFHGNSSLGNMVKYFTEWAIILGAIVVFGVLIKSGVGYITSAGNPTKRGKATTDIGNGFLGLAILLGSYLILYLVNPQLTLIEIKEKAPTIVRDDAPVLADDDKTRGVSDEDVEQMKEASDKLFTISGRIKDFSRALGDGKFYAKECEGDVSPSNSADCVVTRVGFKIASLRRLGLRKNDEGVFDNYLFYFYPKKYYKGDPIIVTGEKYIDENGHSHSISTTADNWFVDITFTKEFPDDEIERLYMPGGKGQDYYKMANEVEYPPLSAIRVDIGNGVHFYTEEEDADHLSMRAGKLDENSLLIEKDGYYQNYNNKIARIKINNLDEIYDFFAVLFEKGDFTGNARLFFGEKEREIKRRVKEEVGNVEDWDFLPDKNTFTNIKDGDDYGSVDNISSVMVNLISNQPLSTCQEIKFCTRQDLKGECLIYRPEAKELDEGDADYANIWLPEESLQLSYLTPVNIPGETAVRRQSPDGVAETKRINFLDEQIRSVELIGDCFLLLAQNPIDEWSSKGTGRCTSVFERSDYNLTDDKIGNCSILSRISFLGSPSVRAFLVVPQIY